MLLHFKKKNHMLLPLPLMDDLSDLLSVAATAAVDGSRGAHALSEESEEKKTNAETTHWGRLARRTRTSWKNLGLFLFSFST